MPRQRNIFVDYLAYLAFRTLEAVARAVDIRANYAICRAMGDLAWLIDRRHRNRAMGHLRRSFPHWSDQQCRRVGRESMRSLVCVVMELLLTTRKITPTSWHRHVQLGRLGQALRLMLAEGGPVVFVTGHFGNWEVIAYTMSVLGVPIHAVARAMDNPLVARYVTEIRQRSGLTVLDKKGATEHVDDILSSGGALAWVADQDAGRKGAFVDFFGRPASTFKSIALLAMRYRAPVVVGYGLRVGGDYDFMLDVERIIRPAEWEGQKDPVRWLTQEYTRGLEAAIRRHPEQYLWAHRRWKSRPKGEHPPADGIA